MLVATDEAGAARRQGHRDCTSRRTRPTYLTREDVPADVVENERRIAEETSRNEGKPEAALPKIIEGRLNGFFKENVLRRAGVRQGPEEDGRQVLAESGGTVTGFVRFRVGA